VNILYITQWLSSVGGGGEVVFYDLAKGISDNGHSVYVICHQLSQSENRNQASDDSNNLQVRRIRPVVHGFPPSIFQHLMFIFNAIIKGSKIIRTCKIDLIHVNNFAPVIVGSVLSRLFNIPVVSTIHVVFGSSPEFWKKWSSQDKVSSITSIVGPRFENLTIKIPVDTIHCVSNATKEDVLKVNRKSRVVVIPNGIDLTIYDKLVPKIDYQNYVVFIGRLVFNKNLDTIISSFTEVKKINPDAKLIVIGHGPMLNKWRSMVAYLGLTNNIQFTEYISQERKIHLLSKCSALILPSITEGMPLVVLEAFALRKAVILSDIEPHHDIVDDGSNGFLVPPLDAKGWANRINFLLSNRNICEEMGKNARAKVEKDFTMSKTVEEIEALYSKYVRKRNFARGTLG
jgi:glycosyltransferase involved in cell wall biosynthesis